MWQKDLWLACHMFKWLTTYLGFEDHCKALTGGGQMNKGNIQTSAPPSSRTTPYLWRMAPIRRSAPPPLYFAVCPKFSLCLKFCAIAKCWAWLHLPADGSKWSWLQNWPLGQAQEGRQFESGLNGSIFVWSQPFQVVFFHSLVTHVGSYFLKNTYTLFLISILG